MTSGYLHPENQAASVEALVKKYVDQGRANLSQNTGHIGVAEVVSALDPGFLYLPSKIRHEVYRRIINS